MPATDWAQASIHQSRIREVSRPPKEIPSVEPVKIETDDVRWEAVNASPQGERRLMKDLNELGLRTYCPLAKKIKLCRNGVGRSPRKFIHQIPAFTGYIFVGLREKQYVRRGLVDRIISVLSDSAGPLKIRPALIAHLNTLELAGYWDETRHWREKSPFQPGSPIRVIDGAYASFTATVDALVSESRIRAWITMFGRPTAIELDTNAVEVG